MNIDYFYFLSFFYLLVIIEWTHAGSLRSLSHSRSTATRRQPPLNVDSDVSTSEPVLCRRRPILISSQSHRRRRWLKDDEVEIPFDQTNTLSDAIPSDNATLDIKHTVMAMDEEIFESNDTNTEQSTEKEVVLTTMDSMVDVNVTETAKSLSTDDEFTTIESIKENQTDITVTDEVSIPNTTIFLSDDTSTFPSAIDTNETSTDSPTEVVQEDTTIINIEDVNSTTIDNISQNHTEVSDTSTMISEDNTDQSIVDTTMVSIVDEYSNETTQFVSTTTAKPICDQSCQCLRKCHYGFEIINGTCQCDEPCKNYQCFRNDTCSVSKEGKPICQPEKGSVHDRPSRCYQARDAGYHDDGVRYYNRWYYNADQDTCHLFIYRGMGGNENNFLTLHECHLECITCAPSPDPGTCLGHLSMWYYDKKKNQCSQFVYSGCKGNENKFFRKQDCINTCITRIINL